MFKKYIQLCESCGWNSKYGMIQTEEEADALDCPVCRSLTTWKEDKDQQNENTAK